MINKVSINNFKCLRNVQFDLERFTVFVGPNASGKSSIFKAIDFLCKVFHNLLGPNGHSSISEFQSKECLEPVEVAAEAKAVAYQMRSGFSLSPLIQTRWSGDEAGVAPSLSAVNWQPWDENSCGSTSLPCPTLLGLEVSKLVLPRPGPVPDDMSEDGSGLHTALAGLALNDPNAWDALQSDLRQIIPSIRRLRHTRPPTMALLFDTVGADSIQADQISEGTLLVLGMLAALYSSQPMLLLLDDLDRGLHPRAQKEIVNLLRSLLKRDPDLQILATTHSPYMLDCMGVNEVRMTALKEDGSTVCAPLTSHPDFPKWKGEMLPGEMWSLFGEKWVTEEVTA